MERKVTVIPSRNKTEFMEIESKPKKIRVAAYCRVSTEQDEQLNSFENQVNYYTEYINKNPCYEMAGIYTDEGISGTNTRKRAGFNKMIDDCEAKKIDLIITKSISRFARNTQDCLQYTRKLKNLGVGVIFEKENISTLDATGELMFTILSSLAQEESRNISENCKWGIRSKFKKGIPHLNTYRFMGYNKNEEGRLEIDEKQAEVVRRIYKEFLEGYNPSEIAARLVEDNIPGVTGEAKWVAITVVGMLKNEKYKGDSLLQKTYISDYLTKKMKKNDGEITQYYVKDSHPAIVSEEEWNAVQLEFERREKYKIEHNIKQYGYGNNISPFCSKVFCGNCGSLYGKKGHKDRKDSYWQCHKRKSSMGMEACKNENIKDNLLKQAFIIAWNGIVKQQDAKKGYWRKIQNEGNDLQRLRTRQMQEVVAEGKITKCYDELVKLTLEKAIIMSQGRFVFYFLDGTVIKVNL